MGDSITEGDLQEILKAAGDPVQTDEIVAIIETDKVNVDIRSPVTGSVESLNAAEGDTVEVGALLMTIALGDGVVPPPPQPTVEEPNKEVSEVAEKLPVAPTMPSKSATRVPLIKFRYGVRDEETDANVETVAPLEFVEYVGVPEKYMRKPLSEEAIALIEMGGAAPY